MKSLQRPSFFRMFDLLLSTTNPGFKLTRWAHDGVEFERKRHSFSSPRHGLTIEIITLTRSGRRGWSLMVTKEYWWAGVESKPFKNLRWGPPARRPAQRPIRLAARARGRTGASVDIRAGVQESRQGY
jgi:hypothetical protein